MAGDGFTLECSRGVDSDGFRGSLGSVSDVLTDSGCLKAVIHVSWLTELVDA